MPSSPGYNRNYQQERKTAIARGETGNGKASGDNKRHKARRAMEKKLGRKLSPDEVVDHKHRLKDGGSNDTSNLRIKTLSDNASDGGKVGSRQGKAAGGRKKKIKVKGKPKAGVLAQHMS